MPRSLKRRFRVDRRKESYQALLFPSSCPACPALICRLWVDRLRERKTNISGVKGEEVDGWWTYGNNRHNIVSVEGAVEDAPASFVCRIKAATGHKKSFLRTGQLQVGKKSEASWAGTGFVKPVSELELGRKSCRRLQVHKWAGRGVCVCDSVHVR
jgi:hypothetical protein